MKSGILGIYIGRWMRLFAGEFMLYYCDFRWTTGHILQRIYMGVWKKTCKQALRLGLLVEQG